MIHPLLALLAAQAAAPATPPPTPPPPLPSPPLPTEAVESDWRPIADDALLVMTLAGDRRVVIRLSPDYAPEHVANIRRLALAHWWDGESVYRVQENWVAQWGDQTEHKPLPAGIVARPAAEYDLPTSVRRARVTSADAYSGGTGITADGWAIAVARATGRTVPPAWLAHCYGTVGVARDAAPDTGTGAELFMPIGGSARRLDRNYTIVGRVIEGAQYLSGLPRSDAAMGMYATAAERLGIVSVRLASDLPEPVRPRYQYRAVDTPSFAALLAAKLDPKPPTVALGGIDVCDVPLPTRKMP